MVFSNRQPLNTKYMKPQKITLIIFLLFALMKTSSAQLAGGTYTIGGTTPDYATVQAAATALASGISGPVVFNIRPGVYFGKFSMGNVPGSSASNTIIFKAENGDSTSVVIADSSSASASSNFTILINGTDFLTFRNLTIARYGTKTYATVFYIGANSRYFQLRNCIVRSDNTTGASLNSALIYLPIATPNDSGIKFTNSIFNNGWYGLNIIGQGVSLLAPLMEITNNIFDNQTGGGIQLSFAAAPLIQGNRISTTVSGFGYKGISLRRLRNDFKVRENYVTGATQGQAISLDTCSGDSGNEALVANNFLQSGGTGNATGIYLSQCSSINFYYNSVHLATSGAGNATFRLNNAGNSAINVKNNIFVNSGGGYTFYIPAGANTNLTSVDYNDLYVGGSSPFIAFFDTGNVATFSDWQTLSSYDANSVSGDPQFISSTDLHVGSVIVNNSGVVVAGVTTDIDGQSRSNSTPDIGADEFVPLNNNIGALAFISPQSGTCGDSSTVVGIIIRNFGLSSQTGFDVHADVTGTTSQMLTETFSGSLASNTSDTVYFSQVLNTYSGGSWNIQAYTSLSGDQYLLNDTIIGTFNFDGYPNAPVVVSPQQQCDNNLQITATADSGNTLVWYDQPTGGNLLYVGSVFSPIVSTDTTFYVEARTGSGTGGCIRITEIDMNFDFIEIQNISGSNFDATGWQVIASNDYTDINFVNDSTWHLGNFTGGEIQYRTDNGVDNYWGTNLLWEPGPTFGGWAMIIDDNYNIIDFAGWVWDSAALNSLNITVDGHTITVGSEWLGNGIANCNLTTDNHARIGSEDLDLASDFTCAVATKGTQNVGLATVFANCGIGSCGSPRLPIDIILVPGVTTNIGNDTIVASPFLITLDGGSGFASYVWSTGDTTQTIDVDSAGTYWVTVTGGPNNCSFTDSISIQLNVGINGVIGENEISFYPNPVKDKLTLTGRDELLKSAFVQITDLEGRIIKSQQIKSVSGSTSIDLNDMGEGVYFLRITSGNRTGVKKFVVLR